MNCKGWEERIALHAGGDLGAAPEAEVARHLEECAECRAFAGAIEAGLELLRSAHAQPIAAGHYTAVRAGVLARLKPETTPRRAWRRWIWVFGCAAGLALAVVLLTVRPAESPRVLSADRRSTNQPPLPNGRGSESTAEPRSSGSGGHGHIQTGPKVRAAVVRPVRVPDVRPRPRIQGPSPLVEPIVVKLFTDDPDIVIYWIADRKGEEE